MKLYFSKHACSLAIRILIHELNLSCEYEAVDLKTKQTATGGNLKTINSKGNVPTLILDDGQILVESVAIHFYFAEKYPQANLIPAKPPTERYQVIEWLSFIATDLHKSFIPFFAPNVPEEAKQGIFKDILRGKFNYVDRALADHRYLHGDQITSPDFYLFVITRWLVATPLSIDLWPNLKRYMDEMSHRPSIQAALAEEKEG